MGNKRDSLGDRMKDYENISRNYLTRRIPVIIRVDGKAFHTFTKGMQKPFDRILMATMQETMKQLCQGVQGCVFGYTQSDEITLVLTDYETINTDAWFGYNIQKMASVVASMATLAFNKSFPEMVDFAVQYYDEIAGPEALEAFDISVYKKKFNTAMFDARVFSIPKEEVCNCLIWRQQDATRNSIEAVGQANFSHSQLHGKGCNAVQDMLWKDCGINWNDYSTDCKRGSCCIRKLVREETPIFDGAATVEVHRNRWVVDCDPPIFSQDRDYIEEWL